MILNKEEGNLLIDFYGSLLNKHQLEILTDYYIEDLSMIEIAENNKVSKAAISDIINRSIKQLKEYDEKLKLIEQNAKIENLINKLEKDNNINYKYIEELKRINRG